jgi:hypothetical protein
MQPLSKEGVLLCGRAAPVSALATLPLASCLDVDNEARPLAGGVVMVTLDGTVCSGYLGADDAPPLLGGETMMVTLDLRAALAGRWVSVARRQGVDGDIGQRVESGGPPGGDLEASWRSQAERWGRRAWGVGSFGTGVNCALPPSSQTASMARRSRRPGRRCRKGGYAQL